LIRPVDAVRVWLKEASVGILNGAALGSLIAAAAWAWKGNPYLGAVVGAAMAINTLVAVSLGGVVPLLLKRIRVDPALASGPILTTVTDMCGFALVLGIATAFLPWLSQA
jgi:magnesium transporter